MNMYSPYPPRIAAFGLGLVVFLLLANLCLFTIDQTKQAIVLRFGEPVKVHSTAGLKLKLPWPIETVSYFDRRILDVDPRPERVNLSSERGNPIAEAAKQAGITEPVLRPDQQGGMPVIVNTYARYKINDPLLFLQRLGTEENAENRIESVMNSATRDVLGKATLADILSPRRVQLMEAIRDRVNAEMKPRGVEIVDIRIIRADLTEQLRESTVNRMITERTEQATETRASGQQKAVQIKAQAERERTVILAEAQRDAQTIRGDGDNQAIKLYAAAFNRDPSFYAFWRSMEAYRNSLATKDTQLVLSPDTPFLKYLREMPRGTTATAP